MCWCVGKLLLLASMLKRLFKRSQSGASGAETHLLDLLLQAGLSLCLPIHHDPSEVYTACRGSGRCCRTIRIPNLPPVLVHDSKNDEGNDAEHGPHHYANGGAAGQPGGGGRDEAGGGCHGRRGAGGPGPGGRDGDGGGRGLGLVSEVARWEERKTKILKCARGIE